MEESRGGLAGRIQGTSVHPLTWGGICGLLFLFFINDNIKINALLKWIILVLMFINVIFSGSRAALLSVIIGSSFIFVLSKNKVKLKLLKYASILGLALIIALYQIPQLEPYKNFFEATIFFWDQNNSASSDIKGSSMDARFKQLKGSFDLIESNFILGLGPGFISDYSSNYGVHPVLYGFESVVYLALVEGGVLGLLVWIFFLRRFVKIPKLKLLGIKNKNARVLFQVLIISYILFIVMTGIQSTLYLFLVFTLIFIRVHLIEKGRHWEKL